MKKDIQFGHDSLTLSEFVEDRGSQKAAAEALGCNQSAISQAIKAINSGKKEVFVIRDEDGSYLLNEDGSYRAKNVSDFRTTA